MTETATAPRDMYIETNVETSALMYKEPRRRLKEYRSCWTFSSYSQLVCAALFFGVASIIIVSVVAPIALEKAKDALDRMYDPYSHVQRIEDDGLTQISDKAGIVVIAILGTGPIKFPTSLFNGRTLILRNVGAIDVNLDVQYLTLGAGITVSVVPAHQSVQLFFDSKDATWIQM